MMAMLRKIASFLREWSRFPSNFLKLRRFMAEGCSASYLLDTSKRKSKSIAWMENLAWLARHREVNEFYYAYQFDEISKQDFSEFMPYEEFRKLRDRINFNRHLVAGRDYSILLRDKFVFNNYMEHLRLSVPRTVAFIQDNKIRWAEDNRLYDLDSLFDPARPDFSAYCKYVYGECGEKIYRLVKRQKNVLLDDREIDKDELAATLKGMFFVQEEAVQHPELAAFYPLATNTLRLYTVMTKNGPELFYALMRFGAHGNRLDNWAIGGIIIKVDPHSGELHTDGYFKPGFGGKTKVHPHSGRTFGGNRVPFFSDAVSLVMESHRYFYGIRHIGWDVAITPNGPVVIEGNDNWEISLLQCLDQKGWKRWMYDNSRPEPL